MKGEAQVPVLYPPSPEDEEQAKERKKSAEIPLLIPKARETQESARNKAVKKRRQRSEERAKDGS
jgi:hypothetical protein